MARCGPKRWAGLESRAGVSRGGVLDAREDGSMAPPRGRAVAPLPTTREAWRGVVRRVEAWGGVGRRREASGGVQPGLGR
eukprot:4344141-Prymnesium_polylepis.1